MKILSFNVGIWSRNWKKSDPFYWKNRMALMAELLAVENPDVICFQELWFPATLFIPNNYKRIFGTGLEHPIYVRKGVNHKLGKFRIHWSSAVVNGIKIFSTHGHWNENITIKLCKSLNDNVKDTDKALLVGDWNVVPEDLFKHLDKRFHNVREELNLPAKNTYEHFYDPARCWELDYFVSYNLSGFKNYRIIPSKSLRISDHDPISIEV